MLAKPTKAMKKCFLFAIAALAALAMTACSNDGNPTANSNEPVEMRLSGSLQGLTRATSRTQATSLSEGEKAYAWVDDATTGVSEYEARELTSTASGGFTCTPMFFPQTGNGASIYAMHGTFSYSFSEGDAFPGADGVRFMVAADQSSMGAAYTKSDLLYATRQNVARTKDNVELTFYHMLSKIEIAIVRDANAPELAAENAVTITDVATDGTFKPAKADISSQAARQAMITAGTTREDMLVGQRISTSFGAGDVDYNEAIIVPQDMAGKKIKFRMQDGSSLSYTIPAFATTPGAATFESGKRYIYHVTLKLSGLDVSVGESIGWGTDGASGNGFICLP